MRLNRIMALALAGVMVTTTATGFVGCSKKEKKGSDKLVIWTIAKDLQTFADQYKKEKGVDVDVQVIEPGDYPKKLSSAMDSGSADVDIIVGEPQMLEGFYEAGYFADITDYAKDYEGKVVDYVWEAGKDKDGKIRAISYQVTPAGFYYRRSVAKEVLGTDDPAEVGKYFSSYDKILETAETMKKAGIKMFASDAETSYFSGSEPWVVDNKLNVAQSRIDYANMSIKLWKDDYTAYATQWSAPWYMAMAGDIPNLTGADVDVWDNKNFEEATKDLEKTRVFAFGLPAWGVLTMKDHVKESKGDWGVCAGPCYGFGGGTFIGVSELSDQQDKAWEFIKWATLTESTLEWWIKESQGDTVALKSVLEKHAEDKNEIYGGQQLYKFWLEQAQGIDYSLVTPYDKEIGDAWGKAIGAIKTGEKSVKDAVAEFYTEVHSTYPDLEIEEKDLSSLIKAD